MYDLYEHTFGIFKHINNPMKSPLASVAMHKGEDYVTGGLLEEAVKTYVARGIKDLYGLSLLEFLELPIDIVEVLVKMSSEVKAREVSMLEGIQKELKS